MLENCYFLLFHHISVDLLPGSLHNGEVLQKRSSGRVLSFCAQEVSLFMRNETCNCAICNDSCVKRAEGRPFLLGNLYGLASLPHQISKEAFVVFSFLTSKATSAVQRRLCEVHQRRVGLADGGPESVVS